MDMNSEKIFITGGCGFIGANLVKHLLDRDRCQVTVYDNLSVGSKSNLERAIAEGESGSGARLTFPDSFRSARDQCQAARVPFFFKQWGSAYPDVLQANHYKRAGWQEQARNHGRILDGRTWDEFPED